MAIYSNLTSSQVVPGPRTIKPRYCGIEQHSEYPFYDLPESLQKVAVEVSYKANSSVEVICMLIFSAISVAAMGKAHVHFNGRSTNLSMFFGVLMDSGEGKTTVSEIIFKFLKDAEEEINAQCSSRNNEYKKDMIVWKTELKLLKRRLYELLAGTAPASEVSETEQSILDHGKKEPQKPERINLVYKDTTMSALAKGLSNFPFGFVYSDEGSEILLSHTSDNLSTFANAYSGSSVVIHRSSKPAINIPTVYLGLLYMVQSTIFRKFMQRKGDIARSSGFLPRTMFAVPQINRGSNFINAEITQSGNIDNFQKFAKTLVMKTFEKTDKSLPESVAIGLTSEAASLYVEFRNYIEVQKADGEMFEDIHEFASRVAENALRLAGAFQVAQSGPKGDISYDILDRACAICLWHLFQVKKMIAIVDTSTAEDHQMLLIKHLVKLREINPYQEIFDIAQLYYRGPTPLRQAKYLRPAIKGLVDRGLIFHSNKFKPEFIQLTDLFHSVRY